MKSFLSVKDLTKDEIHSILDLAKEIESNPIPDILEGKIVGSLFFEPSTRTRLSFTSAAYRLGAKVLGFDSPNASSVTKGESLRDTIKMVESYSDVIVMRHNIEGAAKFADEISRVPIINAGDGANEHPTQTLLDLYTIRKQFGTLENLKIAFVGDLKYGRTVHSLVKALSNFNCQFFFVAPDIIQIPLHILDYIKDKNINFQLLNNYEDILPKIDIMYMTRIQKERFENLDDYNKVSGVYKISKDKIIGKCKDDMIVLHPLPRVDEIDIDLDDTKHGLYFKQAANGVPIRSALFTLALGIRKLQGQSTISDEISTYTNSQCNNIMCVTNYESTENKVIHTSYGKCCYYCGKTIK
ncbi:aspartate carbamoyltransferase [Fusobacterium sp. PH5-44]|uniref:aspartate carbamoyltransferase n=1 Tax=unclassified Fusobacterium TaxID=2648384 RepID=UPI003D244154